MPDCVRAGVGIGEGIPGGRKDGRLSERKTRGSRMRFKPRSMNPPSAGRVSIKVSRDAVDASLRYGSKTGRYPLSWQGPKKTCLHWDIGKYRRRVSRSLWSALSLPMPTSTKLKRGWARPKARPNASKSLGLEMNPQDCSFEARPCMFRMTCTTL